MMILEDTRFNFNFKSSGKYSSNHNFKSSGKYSSNHNFKSSGKYSSNHNFKSSGKYSSDYTPSAVRLHQSTPILDLEEGSILSKDTLNPERWNDSIEDEKKLECLVRLQTIHSKQKFHNSCCVCIIML